MSDYLPPGVTERHLPGGRPEDQEIEATVVLTVGYLRDLEEVARDNGGLERSKVLRENVRYLAQSILEQFAEQGYEDPVTDTGFDVEEGEQL